MVQLSPDYVVGFTDADGSFSIVLSFYNEAEEWVKQSAVVFAVSQSSPRERILGEIKRFFGCGNVSDNSAKNSKDGIKRKPAFQYHVWKIEDIISKVIPFFDEHPPILKLEEYKIWREAAEIIHRKDHLTKEGASRIIELSNRLRGLRKVF